MYSYIWDKGHCNIIWLVHTWKAAPVSSLHINHVYHPAGNFLDKIASKKFQDDMFQLP